MELLAVYTVFVVLSIDAWLRAQGFRVRAVRRGPQPPEDYHRLFRRYGIELDEVAYRNVVRFVEEKNIEAAEYLMMMRCDSPLVTVRESVAELSREMSGGW